MAFVYCLLDEKKDCAYIKVGYTTNMLKRFIKYDTHNGYIEFMGAVECYKKTRHQLELAYHKELERKGATPVQGSLMGAVTEWHKVAYDSVLYMHIRQNGMQAFKTTGRRKVYRLANE